MKELLIELHNYNVWANLRVSDALSKLGSNVPERTLLLFSHIVNAQCIWYSRLRHEVSPYKVFQLHDVETCIKLAEITSTSLLKHLQELPVEQLQTKYTYTNTQGKTYTNTVLQMLTHLVNHSTYHRAQIAMDMRQHGLEPVMTDYIAYAREMNGEL